MTVTTGSTTSMSRPAPADRYAPEFEVRIEGLEADPSTKNDIIDIKVHRDLEEMSGFDLTLNNWDDVHRRFKHSDSETFQIGNRVSIRLGYAEQLLTVATGTISTLAPAFPDGGPPTVGIGGVDGMMQLKDRKPADGETTYYRNVTDAQIAQQVAQRNKLAAHVDDSAPTYPLVVQKAQDDAAFLMERAKRIDYDCYVLPDESTGAQTLNFVRPTDGRDGGGLRVWQLAYAPGLSTGPSQVPEGLTPNLLDFTPTLTISGQVGKVTVRGWDPRAKQQIVYTASASDLPSAPGQKGSSGPALAEKTLSGRQDVTVDAPVGSDQEARDLAISLLRERAYEFITATGRVAGLPELRPGDNLDIYGLGQRFSGTYFVKRVEHTLGSGGFFTQFTARRVFDGGTR